MSGDLAPARGYTWPPFEEGNKAALRHGAYSAAIVQPLAEQLVAQLLADAPWTRAPAFEGTRWSWAVAESQAASLRAHLDEVGLLDDEGEERPAAKMLDRVEARLARLRDGLGLTPQALGKLLGTITVVASATGDTEGASSLVSQGAELLAARGVLVEPTPTPDPTSEEQPDG